MKLFICYARVEKPFCLQVVDTLDGLHEVWYDQRLYAGTHWWNEILRRLDWCEGFVYLISPDSVKSEYCQKEYELAQRLHRHIFPVLINSNKSVIPPALKELQYVDMSRGLTLESANRLLRAISYAERTHPKPAAPQGGSIQPEDVKPPAVDTDNLIREIATAMDEEQYDRAVYLAKLATNAGYKSEFIDLQALLDKAEEELRRQSEKRELEREYNQIVELVSRSKTRSLGCEAFRAFRSKHPDYDPHNIVAQCSDYAVRPLVDPPPKPAPAPGTPRFDLPMLEWCAVPEGRLSIELKNDKGILEPYNQTLERFFISKYPVTNAQYRVFVQDPEGYMDPRWWDYNSDAREWHKRYKQPRAPRFDGALHPRENINWYEAMAFSRWLAYKLRLRVTLPTVAQWCRAARGDSNHLYAWGDEFQPTRCNTSESYLRQTSDVTCYPHGASPYGVVDLCGNVWEWCLDSRGHALDPALNGKDVLRAVLGGSFVGPASRAAVGFHYYLNPLTAYATIGFRVVYLP